MKTKTGLERPAALKESTGDFSGLVLIIGRKKTNVNRKNTQLDAGAGERKSDEKGKKKVKMPKTPSGISKKKEKTDFLTKREREGGGKNINYVTIERRKCRKKQNGRIPVQNDGEGRKKRENFSKKGEKTPGAVGRSAFEEQCDRPFTQKGRPSEGELPPGLGLAIFPKKSLTK